LPLRTAGFSIEANPLSTIRSRVPPSVASSVKSTSVRLPSTGTSFCPEPGTQ
jgi:hypothetical protein